MEKATELEFLRYFFQNADFGPADGEVRFYLGRDFERVSGKEPPDGYREEEE